MPAVPHPRRRCAGGPAPDLSASRDAALTVARRSEGLERFAQTYRQLARLFRALLPDVALVVQAGPCILGTALWTLLQNAARAARASSMPAVRLILSEAPPTFTVKDNGLGLDDLTRFLCARRGDERAKTGRLRWGRAVVPMAGFERRPVAAAGVPFEDGRFCALLDEFEVVVLPRDDVEAEIDALLAPVLSLGQDAWRKRV